MHRGARVLAIMLYNVMAACVQETRRSALNNALSLDDPARPVTVEVKQDSLAPVPVEGSESKMALETMLLQGNLFPSEKRKVREKEQLSDSNDGSETITTELLQGWENEEHEDGSFTTAPPIRRVPETPLDNHGGTLDQSMLDFLTVHRLFQHWLEGVLLIFASGALASFVHSRYGYEEKESEAIGHPEIYREDMYQRKEEWAGWLLPFGSGGEDKDTPVIYCGYCRETYESCNCGGGRDVCVSRVADAAFGMQGGSNFQTATARRNLVLS